MAEKDQKIEKTILAITRQFLHEMGANRAARTVRLTMFFDRDLGLGSLERAELFHQVEKRLAIQLSQTVQSDIQTVQDLVRAVQQAKPTQRVLQQNIVSIAPAAKINLKQAKTLLDVLQLHVEHEAERPHIYLQDEYGKEDIMSYADLYQHALQTAYGIQQYGIEPGDTVALMSPTAKEFFYAFVGILMAGAVPVPIYPPWRLAEINEYAKREASILNNAEVKLLITFKAAERLGQLLKAFVPSLIDVVTVAALQKTSQRITPKKLNEKNVALIQYTSGSTGDPKGVLLSHQNLLANIRAYGEAGQIKLTDIVVSWLPLYHDMGLIGAWLGSLYYGLPLVLLSPLTFLAHPERWLWAIHYHRGTVSAAPNFAYELCLKKIEDTAIEGLDLSSWRLVLNGAEAIYPKTMQAFAERFAPYGLKKEVMTPAYGLAECSVALSVAAVDKEPYIDRIAYEKFIQTQKALPAAMEEKILEFVSCGKPLLGHDVRIVDENNHVLKDRHVGAIQFKGPSAMLGYHRKPEATANCYHQGWWDTGDLGYLVKGELFVTGRKKDLMIKAGKNYYPEEFESIVSTVDGVRKGCVIAFGLQDFTHGTEKIILVAERAAKHARNVDAMIAAIIAAVTKQLGVPPDRVVIVSPHVLPKTSSGKLRRSELKMRYLSGELEKKMLPPWLQVTKLIARSVIKKLTSLSLNFFKAVYGLYVGLLLLLTLLPTWLIVLCMPRCYARKIVKGWAWQYVRLAGCSLKIVNKRYLLSKKPMIYTANHASYVDTLILATVLPANILMIGKKELHKVPILSSLMRKLGHLTVDRIDFAKNLQDVQQIEKALITGRSVFIFPEGTFTFATGIRPFKMGAFKLAIETQTAICPISLRGTRHILRGERVLPTPGRVTITVSKPIKPRADTWQEALRLRQLTRTQIIKYSGEQSLNLLNSQLGISGDDRE